jgi:carboxypeptidase Taq
VLQHQILTDKKVGQWLQKPASRISMMSNRPTCGNAAPVRSGGAAAGEPGGGKIAGRQPLRACLAQPASGERLAGFADNLREVVKLSREEAQIRADAKGGSRYDALLDIFEPDMTSARLDACSPISNPGCPAAASGRKAGDATLIAPQGLSRSPNSASWAWKAMRILGFDFDGGRLDISAHPFCGGVPRMCASPPATTKTTCSARCSA